MVSTNPPKLTDPIYELGFHEPFRQAGNRPFIKLLNWFTGFGKTYNAARFAAELKRRHHVIPVFIAPLHSLVSGFVEDLNKHAKAEREYADDVEETLRACNADLPVYRLYSVDYHVNDRTFFAATLNLLAWLSTHPHVEKLLDGSDGTGDPKKSYAARAAELRSKCITCRDSQFWRLSPSDDAYGDARDAYLKAARRARSIADSLTRQLIRLDIDSRERNNPKERYLSPQPVAEMVLRLHPLQAFLDAPGVIVCTASKAQVEHTVFAIDEARGRRVWRRFENLPLFLKELNRDQSKLGQLVSGGTETPRVVTFVDEEEDAYWYLFDQRKSVVNSEGRNDLNIVVTEFFTFFDLKWPLAFEHARPRGEAMAAKVLEHLEDFAGVAEAVEREFQCEKQRTRASFVVDARRVSIFRSVLQQQRPATAQRFDDGELLLVLQQLLDKNDVHNGFRRFRQKAKVLAKLLTYVTEQTPEGMSAYERFRFVCSLACDKKYFTMNRSTYGEVLEQPCQTFFNDTSSVMDTEFLRRVELLPDTAYQTVRLHHHDARAPSTAYSLFNYLELILFIARVLVAPDGEEAIDFTAEDVERYPNLSRFRNDVRRLFKASIAGGGLRAETQAGDVIREEFFYSDIKNVVTLEESRHQADEYNLTADVCLTLTITSLKASPEEDIVNALGRNSGVFLMSATGGLSSISSGAFNVAQLRRALEAKGGVFSEMTAHELEIVAREAQERLERRDRHVVILDDTKPEQRFNVSKGFKGLLRTFHDARPERGELGYVPLNRHKENEIAGLVASLDRLLSTDVRSGLVLCQTFQHVQKCLVRLANRSSGFIEQLDDTGNHFVIHPKALPSYKQFGETESITLILYKASRFRRIDRDKTGAIEETDDVGQFNDELLAALDISTKKVLLWSAYASASRGINFITRQDGEERDFELFCLLNDPYYTRHTRPGTRGFSMEMFQSFAQVLRDENDDWTRMTRKDLLYEYARTRWQRLRKEHLVDITRTVFQALGRGERRPHQSMRVQAIFLSSEAARMVHLGLRHASALRERASPAQRAVLAALERHNAETLLFENEQARAGHVKESLKLALRFRDFTSAQPKRFRTDEAVRTAWSALFHRDMFTAPAKYLDRLPSAGVPAAYNDGCYLQTPHTAELYRREAAMAGICETIITDAADGADMYDWVSMVAPEGLISALSKGAQKLLNRRNGFEIDTGAGKQKLVPQPWFVTEIMKGYLAELEFEAFVDEQFGIRPDAPEPDSNHLRFVQLDSHPLRAELYQLFDYYIETRDNVVVAVDMKNWARSTDSMKRDELLAEAEKKHARLTQLLPDKTVHALYVNLYGALKYSVKRPERGSIRFMSLYVPNISGMHGWMQNHNLASALLGH